MIPGPRAGIAAALNAGLAAARGEFFARCDCDDLYAPDRLAAQLALLRDRPEFGAVAGSFTYVNASGREIAAQAWGESPEEITHELCSGKGRTHLCTFLIRMEHLRRLEGFRPYFVGTEDADFQLRLGEVCRVWWEPRPAYVYRLHGESITHTQPSTERKFLERMAQEFQKQRRETGLDDLQRGTPPPVPANLKADARQTNKQIQSILIGEAWRAHGAGRRMRAISTGLRACMAAPVELGAWKSLAALAVKPRRGPGRAGSVPGR
jgi:GT2 family glycosyltransferase